MTMSLAFEKSLEESIRGFLKEEVIDHGERYKCGRCK